MKDWADYMSDADLEHISQVTTGSLGVQERDITRSYNDNGGKCKEKPPLLRTEAAAAGKGISHDAKIAESAVPAQMRAVQEIAHTSGNRPVPPLPGTRPGIYQRKN